MLNMDEKLRQQIGETTDATAWEIITGILWKDGIPFQLWKFEQDVEFNKEMWRCLIIQKLVFYPDDIRSVDYCEDIMSEAWKL